MDHPTRAIAHGYANSPRGAEKPFVLVLHTKAAWEKQKTKRPGLDKVPADFAWDRSAVVLASLGAAGGTSMVAQLDKVSREGDRVTMPVVSKLTKGFEGDMLAAPWSLFSVPAAAFAGAREVVATLDGAPLADVSQER